MKMEEPIVVGIDIGTTKVCTLIGRIEGERGIRVLGVGIEPSQGIRKGTIVDLAAAAQSIARSIEKAQRSSGLEITDAQVSLAGSHISSVNNRGVAAVSGGIIDINDVHRALEAAQAVNIPHNREIITTIQRGFIVDGQDGIRSPIGMHGYRLEVEAHMITAAQATVENIRQSVEAAGVHVTQFVLNPLASAEVVLSETERNMGSIICDIGGGTTDLAIYIDGDVWHTMVLAVGGNHITSDIAHGLRLPMEEAEKVKKQFGHAIKNEVSEEEMFTVRSFGDEAVTQIPRRDLAHIIEARAEEIFELVLQEIKRSGYDGLLPAGMVLTGGSSLLPGIRPLASRILGLPVRLARPENLVGLVDQLHSPAFSTSVGLLYFAMAMNESAVPARGARFASKGGSSDFMTKVMEFLKRISP
ncbi:MAG: cell division protein FtsA [Chloroflexi bacterium HGW-Chloroflexi-10]|nr:MAG: cell division protein FtsA [Chloroflexi bacterium HGW-Chloroflexi-10]